MAAVIVILRRCPNTPRIATLRLWNAAIIAIPKCTAFLLPNVVVIVVRAHGTTARVMRWPRCIPLALCGVIRLHPMAAAQPATNHRVVSGQTSVCIAAVIRSTTSRVGLGSRPQHGTVVPFRLRRPCTFIIVSTAGTVTVSPSYTVRFAPHFNADHLPSGTQQRRIRHIATSRCIGRRRRGTVRILTLDPMAVAHPIAKVLL